MNNQSQIICSFIIALSILGLSLLSQKTPGLASNEHTAPIDDGARHLRGLESKNSADWDFALEEKNQKQTDYQLSIYEQNFRIVEQKQPEWRNTGEQSNYSVLVDLNDLIQEQAP